MTPVLLTHRVQTENDVVIARRRGRQVAGLLGLGAQDQARLSTAVSEIARNALDYAGGGKVEYGVRRDGAVQEVEVRVIDQGPGIAELDAILEGRYRSATGLGIGITGTRRLMDRFEVDTRMGEGTTVVFAKRLAARQPALTPAALGRVADELVRNRPDDVVSEMQEHTQDLLRALDELRVREEEGARLYAEARAATRARDDVLAIVSHDLRNPLHTIFMGATFLLEVGAGAVAPEALEDQLRIFRRAAQRANRLIDDLLDVGRIESGRLAVEPGPEPPAFLLAEAEQSVMAEAAEKGVTVTTRTLGQLPAVLADRDRIVQVLCNLGTNAVKFTAPGGAVEFRAECAADGVRFSVRDNGPGMSAEQLEHAFDRFWQAGRADRRGVGLGLTIVRGIVEAHAGQVSVQSTPGVGTEFSFALPAA